VLDDVVFVLGSEGANQPSLVLEEKCLLDLQD